MSKLTYSSLSLSTGSSESDDDLAIQGIIRLSVLFPLEGPRTHALAYVRTNLSYCIESTLPRQARDYKRLHLSILASLGF